MNRLSEQTEAQLVTMRNGLDELLKQYEERKGSDCVLCDLYKSPCIEEKRCAWYIFTGSHCLKSYRAPEFHYMRRDDPDYHDARLRRMDEIRMWIWQVKAELANRETRNNLTKESK